MWCSPWRPKRAPKDSSSSETLKGSKNGCTLQWPKMRKIHPFFGYVFRWCVLIVSKSPVFGHVYFVDVLLKKTGDTICKQGPKLFGHQDKWESPKNACHAMYSWLGPELHFLVPVTVGQHGGSWHLTAFGEPNNESTNRSLLPLKDF